MAEESRRKRCEVLLDLKTAIRNIALKDPTYDVEPEKAVFLGSFTELINQLLEMCRME
jgi:hypothetical protein